MDREFTGKKIALVAPFDGSHNYSHILKKTMEQLGVEVVEVDYRVDRDKLKATLPALEVDAVIVNRGEFIDPEIIRSIDVPTLLYTGEYIWGNDRDARHRRSEIEYNGAAYDYVVWEGHNEPQAIQILKNLSCSNITWIYPVRIAPDIYRKLDIEKIYDVSFIGSLTPRREEFLDRLAKKFDVHRFTIYDLEEQIKVINQSRINLHINFAPFHTRSAVNLRVFDVLGCGSFMLTEGVEVEEMFKGGEHLAYFKPESYEDLEKKVHYYLQNEDEREQIAENGYQYIYSNYNLEDTVTELLNVIDFKNGKQKAALNEYGIGHDKFGSPAENVFRFQNCCRMMLDDTYPHHHHMFGARLLSLKRFDSAIESFKRALDLAPEQLNTLDLLTRAYVETGNINGAVEVFNKISSINNQYPGLPELNQLIMSAKGTVHHPRFQNTMEVQSD